MPQHPPPDRKRLPISQGEHIGRKAGAVNRTEAEMDAAFSAWLRLGSADAAAKLTGVPVGTLRRWKFEKPERFRAIALAHEEMLAEFRVSLARRAWEAVGEGLDILRTLAVNAPRDADRVNAAGKLVALAVETDKVTRLDAGTPTEITEARSVEDVDAEFARIVADVEAGRG